MTVQTTSQTILGVVPWAGVSVSLHQAQSPTPQADSPEIRTGGL